MEDAFINDFVNSGWSTASSFGHMQGAPLLQKIKKNNKKMPCLILDCLKTRSAEWATTWSASSHNNHSSNAGPTNAAPPRTFHMISQADGKPKPSDLTLSPDLPISFREAQATNDPTKHWFDGETYPLGRCFPLSHLMTCQPRSPQLPNLPFSPRLYVSFIIF